MNKIPLRNLFYLLQLEEYDLKRFNNWLKNNPGRVVWEKKKQIDWTLKARVIFLLAKIFNIAFLGLSPILAVKSAARVLSPIDFISKKILIKIAKKKIEKIAKMKNLIVIGITGSYGKTTTKNTLFHILSQKYKTLKTEGNYNTLLGVAKTIIKNLNKDHQIFICEMGAYQISDIKAICDLTRPKIGIITAISEMHLERFRQPENIFKTKIELIKSLPEDGSGILPQKLQSKIQNQNVLAKIDYFSSNEKSSEEIAVKIGKIFGIEEKKIKEYLKTLPLTPHRRQIIKTASGITIIDDTYNSNPAGFSSALRTLASIPAKKKILTTPGMIELGERQFELNKTAAQEAAAIVDYAIIIGETNKEALRQGFLEKLKDQYGQKIFEVKDLEEAKTRLSQIAVPDSVVLLENDLPDNYF